MAVVALTLVAVGIEPGNFLRESQGRNKTPLDPYCLVGWVGG